MRKLIAIVGVAAALGIAGCRDTDMGGPGGTGSQDRAGEAQDTTTPGGVDRGAVDDEDRVPGRSPGGGM
jgi:hypothetical protein